MATPDTAAFGRIAAGATKRICWAFAPDIGGKWSGTWSSFNPAQATTQPREVCKQLDAEVVRNGDGWVATFEGDCGRPYKYKISMNGRLVSGVVLFTGTVDLGALDGGTFD